MQEQEYILIINELKIIIEKQNQQIELLQQEVVLLKEEIRILKEGKNSKNSSMPPSVDFKKNQSLRISSGKKSGGQLGHEGKNLEMKAIPDVVIEHVPTICTQCGEDLTNKEAFFEGKRQVVDIPPVKAVYTEHQIFSKQCQCGHATQSLFPANVMANIQYGSRTESLIAYMSVRQFIPYARMCEYLEHVHQLPMSEGSIANLLERFYYKAEPSYKKIKENIAQSEVVGSDETGCKINGTKNWVFTWQDEQNTYLSISSNRGHLGIKESFPNGLPNSILVSDAWPAQLATTAKSHQLCTAHLLRDLNYFIDILKDSWSEKVISIIRDALELKKKLLDKEKNIPISEIKKIERRFTKILRQETASGKITAFKKRLIKNRDYIFNFLYHDNVPPDNNGSERAIRNVKVKQKVSGQFKSLLGGNIFVTIRSIIDTALKKNEDVFHVLRNIAIFEAE